ncbi:phosphotransferase [Alphaproteobacteria bacterium LSUCC0684]
MTGKDPALSFDHRLLGLYLEKHIPGFRGLEHITKISGGQSNPTFRLDAASGAYVLRRQPPGELLKSAHAVDREFRIMAALADTAVPVGRVFHLAQDREIIGSMFYVMEYLNGRTFWDPLIPLLTNEDRGLVYDEMCRVLAAIHQVDITKAGLEDYGRPGNYFERQFHRWQRQYYDSETTAIPAMNELIAWLHTNMIADDGRFSIVHGDFRLDNLIFAPDGPRAIAMLDWELSTLGHPLADLAYQCGLWRMPPGAILSGFGGLDRTSYGIPSEDAYIETYCRHTGIDGITNWPFYLAFGLFRIAAIAQGVRKRADLGNASSPRAMELGQLVDPMARLAMSILEEG